MLCESGVSFAAVQEYAANISFCGCSRISIIIYLEYASFKFWGCSQPFAADVSFPATLFYSHVLVEEAVLCSSYKDGTSSLPLCIT